MLDTPPRNKILVVGRRGAGKLSLVQSILGSRFVPTTSASKSRPSSPLILPAIPVPTLEDTVLNSTQDGLGYLTATPPNSSQRLSDKDGINYTQDDYEVPTSQLSQLSTNDPPDTPMRPNKQDHSGVTIPWTIDTKYYSVQVDFWIDETDAQGTAELERMIESGGLDEMGTVVEAVVFCFSKNEPSTFHDIKPWLAFVERHEPSITLCVATDAPMEESYELKNAPSSSNEYIEDYDDWCRGNGFEYIDLHEQRDEVAQDEHVGLDRIMEALAAHMWDGLKRKSSKKRDQHDRTMMMSFQDDDMDMSFDPSWRDRISRSTQGLENLSLVDDQSLYHDNEDDDEDEEDEDEDRVFYNALLQLNDLKLQPQANLLPGTSPRILPKQAMNLMKESQVPSGFDDEFGNDQELEQALQDDDLEDDIWSSQESSTSPNVSRSSGAPLSTRILDKQFKQYLNLSNADDTLSSTDTGRDSSGELSDGAEISFHLNHAQDFEFGDFVVNHGPGGDELEDIDFNFGADGMSTPKQESIRTMHQTLFGNIDQDEGMAHTIAALQGLREQGRTMTESERRDIAARVALAFGMQMGE
ncbi:hypothetical protein BGZ83_008070 [Gryganskiella cystojenkinii]|nr:hypothetical protein BGZ83_008070 [Gryganskiella cystojenkinii]